MAPFTCLSSTSRQMCSNCIQYSREMANIRYNNMIMSLTDSDGHFDVAKGLKIEQEMLKDLKERNVDNMWRIDKMIQGHFHRKILHEMEKRRGKIIFDWESMHRKNWRDKNNVVASKAIRVYREDVIEKSDKKGDLKMKNTEDKCDKKAEVETISTVPDAGICRRYWNPAYYELELETSPVVEHIFPLT